MIKSVFMHPNYGNDTLNQRERVDIDNGLFITLKFYVNVFLFVGLTSLWTCVF